MELTTQHIDRFKDALKDEDRRLTSQRLAIQTDISGSDGHRLQDSEDDQITLSASLYDVLMPYMHLQRSA